jgi:hypothetical protein
VRDAELSSRLSGNSPAPVAGKASAVNPFAVSQVGLAQLDFVEANAGVVDLVVAQLRKASWRGQVIGPHGSGKTTLTIALAKSLAGQFQRFSWLVLHPGRWWFARPRFRVQLAARSDSTGEGLNFLEFRSEEPDGLITKRLQQLATSELCFIDGVDQLPASWQRKLVQAAGKHAVVWTSHQQLAGDLPLIAELRPDVSVFRKLVRQLLDNAGESLEQSMIDEAFEHSDGDFRRAFGTLYDAWEIAKRGG